MSDNIETLVSSAIAASEKAYVPYSDYPVGAALEADDGTIFTGCNVENAAYPVTICAERTALVKAVSEGRRAFRTLIVVTRDGGFPCGMCRQMLSEFAPELRVVVATLEGEIRQECTLADLLPHGFGPHNLGG